MLKNIRNYFTSNLPNLINRLIITFIIILIGFIIGRLLSKFTRKILKELELNSLFKKATGMKLKIEQTIATSIKYLIYFITLIMALDQLGITGIVLYLLAGAVFIILIISIFLSIKDFIPNMISGLSLHKKGFIKKGDHIRVKDIEGKITYISLLETRVETKKGDIINIPNSHLTKNEVIKLKN